MKNILKNIAGALMMMLAFAACTSDEFDGANENGIPTLEGIDYTVSVDQNTNVVTFKLNTPGIYPIWNIEGSPAAKSTVNGFQKKYIFKGTYAYTLKVGNKNGVSDGQISGTFTVDTTRYDFSKTIAVLTDNGKKEWRIYAAAKGHLACGPEGTEGTAWWSAGPQEKAAEGIYDDRITFSNTNDYTYDAGADGLTFCNKGVTTLGVTGAGADYSIQAAGRFDTKTSAKYALGYDDANKVETITFPAKTLFPYIGHDSQMTGEYTCRILKIDSKYMELALDLPGIVWRFTFINGEDPAPTNDFDPDKVNWAGVSDALNLGKDFNTAGKMVFWWSDAGWAQIADPTFSFENGVYTITADNATAARWQAQCSIQHVGLSLEAGEAYDVSMTINVNQAFENACIKICDQSDNPVLVLSDPTSLRAGDNVLRWAKRYPKDGDGKGNDAAAADVKVMVDLGTCPAGLVTKVSNIIIQKHNPK